MCGDKSHPFLEYKVSDKEHPQNIQTLVRSANFALATQKNSQHLRDYTEIVEKKLSSLNNELRKKNYEGLNKKIQKKKIAEKEVKKSHHKDTFFSKAQEEKMQRQMKFLQKRITELETQLTETEPEITPVTEEKEKKAKDNCTQPFFFDKNKIYIKKETKKLISLYQQLRAQLQPMDLDLLLPEESKEVQAFLKYLIIRLAGLVPLGSEERYEKYFRNNALYILIDKDVSMDEMLKALKEYTDNIYFPTNGDSRCRHSDELKSSLLNQLLVPTNELFRDTDIEKEAFYQISVKLAFLHSTIEASALLNKNCKQFVETSTKNTKVTFAKKSGFKIGNEPDQIPRKTNNDANRYRHPPKIKKK